MLGFRVSVVEGPSGGTVTPIGHSLLLASRSSRKGPADESCPPAHSSGYVGNREPIRSCDIRLATQVDDQNI